MTLSKLPMDAIDHLYETDNLNFNNTVITMKSKQGNKLRFYLFSKRAIDIIGSLIGLIITSPLFLTISVFYLFGSQKGPIFFKQKRIGQYGKPFYIYKFRSMVTNAEDKLKSDKELYKKYVANSFKLEPNEDPRITKIGRFLRRTSLDELPQFLNVLKGNMSLIGPRPIVKEELVNYKGKENLFLSAKPGVTGYWQAYGRSTIEYPERTKLELYYIKNRSLLLDIKIFFVTFYSVIRTKGAY